MKHKLLYIAPLMLLILLFSGSLCAQNWKFVKEKDGVQLYTRQSAGKGLKYFKGIAEINTPAERIYSKLEDVYQTDWWTKDVSQIKVLHYAKDRLAQYYLVYDLPWPFKDRDLCVNVTASINRATGERRLTAIPMQGACVVNNQCVRMKEFWEEWKIRPIDQNRAHVELEFYINPGTHLPDWIVNMVLTDSPIKVIRAMRSAL